MNGKYVWETGKRVCDFINTHDDIIQITTFGGNRNVIWNAMMVVKEAHNVERKRMQTAKKAICEEATKRVDPFEPKNWVRFINLN